MKLETVDSASAASPARRETEHNLSPKQRGSLMRALADFQTELFRVEAGFIPAIKDWGTKREMAELVFREARRVQDLRTRCRELGVNFPARHASEVVAGRGLIEVLCHAGDAEAALHAIFTIVKPRLREILADYLEADLRVFDAPSLPVVEADLAEIDRQLAWFAKQEKIPSAADDIWLTSVQKQSAALGEELEGDRRFGAGTSFKGRKIGNLPILNSVIPEGFQHVLTGTPDMGGEEYADRELHHAHNFLMEVQASDSCASLLFEAPDMPWDFYFDCARHMWDEMRHCEFGELKLTAMGHDIRELGLSNMAYVMRQTIDPLDRYVALTTQEADAFPGKHRGLRDALEHNDSIFARAWSYDIADETQHVRYGHKWIPVMIEATGEARSYDQLKRDAENWRRDVLAAVYTPAARSFSKK